MLQLKDGFKLRTASKRAYAFGILANDWLGESDTYQVEVLYGKSAFLGLEATWQELASLDPFASPFTHWEWFKAWIDTYGSRREFLTLVVLRQDRPVAIVPFTWKRHTTLLEMRKLWMLAFDPCISTNGLTEEPVYVMSGDDRSREAIWKHAHEVLSNLVEEGPWDAIAYRKFGLGIEDCSVVEVKVGQVHIEKYWRGSEYVDLPATWDAYQKSLSKSMRENLPYYRKRLDKDGIHVEFESVKPEQSDSAVEDLVRLHKLRTYADSTMLHVDYFGDERQVHLLKSGMKEMLGTGKAKVVLMRANGVVVAAQVFLMKDRTMVSHYSGFDPAWSKYSPLFVLQSQVFRDAIEDGYDTLNLLRGNATWQKRWGASARNQIIDVTISRRSLVPRMRQSLCQRESMFVDRLSNVRAVRRARASFRTWQLTRESA